MSEYYSRLHIKVSSPKVWKKFENEDDASFELVQLERAMDTSFVIDNEWSYTEGGLTGIVKALAETLGPDGIIIADTTNISVDPNNYCIFYLGESIRTDVFSIYSKKEKCEMHSKTNIKDISGWLNYGEFHVSDAEKEQLFRCGIASSGGHFEEFSANLDLPSKIYLRETSFKKRPENIEETFIEEEVYLVHAKDSYDPMRLEVMSNLGSLGYLPSDVSDAIAPVLLSKRLTYTAKVVDLVKLSKRNKHAKSPIVAITIKAEVADKAVPVKTSVPKIDRKALAAAEKKKAEEAFRIEEERKCKKEETRIACEKAEAERKRKEEEARIAEEERLRKAEEARKAEAERKRKEEEARIAREKAEAERKRKEEEARRAEAERKRKEEEARIAREKTEAERKRKEEEARIAIERAEAEEKAKKEAKERRRQEQEALQKKYLEDYAAWEKFCKDIKEKRATEVSKRLSDQKSNLENSIKQKRDMAIKTANDKKSEYIKRKAEAEAILVSLGFFQFGDKKIQKANVETALAKIAEAEADIKTAETIYNTEIFGVTSKVSAMETQITQDVERDMPLPTEPEKPTF